MGTTTKRPSRLVQFMKVVFVGALFGAMGMFVFLGTILADLPRLEGLRDYHPPVSTRVYDRNHELIARYYKDERRTLVPRSQMPEKLVKAFLAAEDGSFYEHMGVDLGGLLAAVLQEVRHVVSHAPRRGGSTITQQTAKTLLLGSQQTYTRKLKEMVLAYRMEQALTKDEILYLYLNQIYFGNGAYGVEEAAQTYFGKSVQELSLAECATLAAIPKNPNVINPIDNPSRSLERRAYVLDQIEKRGFASAADVAAARQSLLLEQRKRPAFLNRLPYYTEEIRQELLRRYGEDRLYREGLVVYAAADARADIAAQRALEEGLAEVDKRAGWRGSLSHVASEDLEHVLQEARRRLDDRVPKTPLERSRRVWDVRELRVEHTESGARVPVEALRFPRRELGIITGAIVTRIDAEKRVAIVDLGTTEATLSVPDFKWARAANGAPATKSSDILRVGDVILVKLLREVPGKGDAPATLVVGLEQQPRVQGAVVSIEPETRRIRTMVGGIGASQGALNRATQAHRQPGSSFKPFIYAAAIQSQAFTPASILVDAPKVFYDPSTGKSWKPENSGKEFRGDMRLRECLTHSINTCSVTLVETLTPEHVIDVAHQVGLGAGWSPNLSLALGTGEVTPLALTNAYATLADAGRFASPVLVERVETADGHVLEETTAEKSQVFDPAVAYVTLSMMKSVIESGTAQRIKELGRPVAGKTGTTNEAREAWFVGCVPNLCTGVYVGHDQHEPMGRSEAGGRAAAPVWLSLHKVILEGTPIEDFAVPEGVESQLIDPRNGLLAAPNQPGAFLEVFLSGTAPQEASGLHTEARSTGWGNEVL